MSLFKNSEASYQHTEFIRDLLYQYDSFLDSLEVVADFGCGEGLDLEWWATLETRDDPPEPRNYLCYAVDQNTKQIQKNVTSLPNVRIIEANLEDPDRFIPRQIDLVWCHDVFQYITNPVYTLCRWNEMISVNGMLVMSIPQAVHYEHNRLNNNSYNGWYFNHNVVNLMYMLAVNGFDCRDAYFYKDMNDMWLHVAVYKSEIAPMNPQTTTWHDLINANLVNESVRQCVERYGYVKQEEILTTWLDKDYYRIKE
jgi:trans-aconitate methyltransferase